MCNCALEKNKRVNQITNSNFNSSFSSFPSRFSKYFDVKSSFVKSYDVESSDVESSDIGDSCVRSSCVGSSQSSCARDIDFGILQEFVIDPRLTDMVITENGRIWLDYGDGLKEKIPRIPMNNPSVLRRYAVWICAQLGKRLDDARPIADVSSASGIRIHAVLAPIVSMGAVIAVRFPSQGVCNLDMLYKKGMYSLSVKNILSLLVRMRANILITGSTGSGKTTLMRALLSEADSNDRIVSVEETRELCGFKGDYVSLSTRESNVEGKGEICLPELVKATLRMRPDRIVLGECRGEEIADLLRVFTSGHHGGMTTLHADDVYKVPARLMSLGLLAGLQPRALCALAAGAFDVVIHVERMNNKRMIHEIGVLTNGSDDYSRCLGLQNNSENVVLHGIPVMCMTVDKSTGAHYLAPSKCWNVFAQKWKIKKW